MSEMEPYDVCVASGEDPVVIRFYASEEDYKDFNPSKIYIIAYKNLKEAYRKYRRLRQEYGTKVEMLREDRDKNIIDIVTDQCHETPVTIVPDWREQEFKKKIVNVYIRFKAGKIMVYGDTYPIKDALKQRGFKWDPDMKAWVTPFRVGVKAELENISIPGVKVVVWEDE
jgi:hypothetical protein